jgi:DNA processing protein
VVVEGATRSGALTTAQWTDALHRPVMGVPGPVTSAASAGVNQLIRLGKASLVTSAQEVITDLATNAYSTAAAAAQLDESFVPGPVRSAQSHVPGPMAPAAAPRR